MDPAEAVEPAAAVREGRARRADRAGPGRDLVALLRPLAVEVVALEVLVAAALGGMGSAWGAILSGLLLGLLEALGAGYVSSGYKDAIALGIGLLILLVRPRGLFGTKLR